MNVIRVNNEGFPAIWKALFQSDEIQHPLLSEFDVKYSKEYTHESRFDDLSFAIADNQTPVMGLRMARRCCPDGRIELSGFGRPIGYLEARELNPGLQEGAGGLLREEIQRMLGDNTFSTVLYQELRPILSPLGRCLLDAGATAIPRFTQVIDLSAPEAELRQKIRKSYKSLINWGDKNLNLRLLDHATMTPVDMENFRRLHIEVAGRETRSCRTWETQYEMVRQNEAFVIFGFIDHKLVTAALFLHSTRYCYYGVSASKRELFDKPLGHSVIWKAILHAKRKGCLCFELGDQLFPNHGIPPPTSKELGISAFKKGFGGETRIKLEIAWTAGGSLADPSSSDC